MDTLLAATIMGVVQGLTEFLPVSSSGHLILAPYLLGPYLPGMRDPFILSLEFSVMLHIGTLAALLLYFRSDWLRLVPAFVAAVRHRSLDGDPDRRLAALLAVATLPALVIGFLLHDLENSIREVGPVAVTLVIGAAILWLAERTGSLRRVALDLTFAQALAIGGAQAIALIPGISRSGISISAALFSGALLATMSLRAAVDRLAAGGADVVVTTTTGDPAPTIPADTLDRRLHRLPSHSRGGRSHPLARLSPADRPSIEAVPSRPMEVMKQLRHRAIRDLVSTRPIRTQQELAAALRDRGFRTTQATMSRDVAELGLIKAARDGTQAYAVPKRLVEAETSGEDRLRALLHDLPIETREAGLLLVIRTLPGSAHAIAAALDRARWPEVAGSIAGDDTVFVACPDRTALRRAAARVRDYAG